MNEPRRIVVDTNVLVSRALWPSSVPARAVAHALAIGRILVSDATMQELTEVLSRTKFDRFLRLDERRGFLRRLGRIAEFVPVTRTIRACRDPRDDKFLELAAAGSADFIVTGDGDLLALDPFEGIAIVTPARFLTMEAGQL